ncbi:hypothetical protein HJFPF1_06903 [Paramyrothecium foliicola]|nr:hypothetical protein HJFPF1_06903 [Paramyrothecium foliicola]
MGMDQSMSWFGKPNQAGASHDRDNGFNENPMQAPRPKTPLSNYSGILTIPSTGFLTPSLHGSPARSSMFLTPSSSATSQPLQESPFADKNNRKPGGNVEQISPGASHSYGLPNTGSGESVYRLQGRELFKDSLEERSYVARAGSGGSGVSTVSLALGNYQQGISPSASLFSMLDSASVSRVLLGPGQGLMQNNPASPAETNMPKQTIRDPPNYVLSGNPVGNRDALAHLGYTTPVSDSKGNAACGHAMMLPPPGPAFMDRSSRQGHFRPMLAVAQNSHQKCGYLPSPPHVPEAWPDKFSIRYCGMHTSSNASADHITDEENCGLWLTNLPPEVDVHDLLAAVRNVGRVWCTYINQADNVRHRTAAAKLVFFTPDAARRMLSISFTKGVFIQGYKVRMDYNRIKSEEHPIAGNVSRVLIITGDSKLVNAAALTAYFKTKFVFEVDEVKELIIAGSRAVVEYRFGSYRCQAQMGKMALEKDRPLGFEKVEFGEDPCEVGDTLSAYGIAAERIQGRGI